MLRRLWVGDMLGVGWITLMSICRVSPQEPVLRAREEAAQRTYAAQQAEAEAARAARREAGQYKGKR